MKRFFLLYILIFLSLTGGLFSYSPPIPPSPTIPRIILPYNKIFELLYKNPIRVSILFNDDKKLSCILYLKILSIPVVYKAEKKIVQEILDLKEIESVEILSWDYRIIKEETEKTQFIFFPNRWKIKFWDNIQKKEIIYNNRIKLLENLLIKNQNKISAIYSIYYDFWIKKQKRWEKSEDKDFKNNKNLVGHPKSFKKITFIKEIK